MTEPTLEEMTPQSYVRRPASPIRAVRWNGSNWDEVHAVYPTLGEEYMRARGCSEGDWVMSSHPGRVDFISHENFTELYTVAAPESEDEAREAFWKWAKKIHSEWFNSHGNLNYNREGISDASWNAWKAAWHARARLSEKS